MKILKLVGLLVNPAETEIHVSENHGVKYHNLRHGTKGSGLWRWSCGLSHKQFRVEDQNGLVLDRDDYHLEPVYSKGELLKDTKGNTCYNIAKDTDSSHSRDILLLWTLPRVKLSEITLRYQGDVVELGKGYSGKSRPGGSMPLPAPVLEIDGDCSFGWIGNEHSTRKRVSQTISYNYQYNKWSIGQVVEVTPEEA